MTVSLTVAAGTALAWSRAMAATHHYLRKSPDPRSRPLAYAVQLGGEPVGCLFFGRPEASRCFVGVLTYGGPADTAAGFRLARTNDAGVETWWTAAVAGLSAEQDQRIRALAEDHPRSVRIRNQRRTLFDGVTQ